MKTVAPVVVVSRLAASRRLLAFGGWRKQLTGTRQLLAVNRPVSGRHNSAQVPGVGIRLVKRKKRQKKRSEREGANGGCPMLTSFPGSSRPGSSVLWSTTTSHMVMPHCGRCVHGG